MITKFRSIKSVIYSRLPTILLTGLVFSFLTGLALEGVYAQTGEDVEARRERLENELAEVEEEIKEQQVVLNQKRQESASIERDIGILQAEIEQAQLNIRKHEIEIQRLGRGINEREETIEELIARTDRSKDALRKLLQERYQMDQESMVEIMLRHDNLSDFFMKIDEYSLVQSALNTSIEEIRQLQAQNREQKEQLSQERDEVQDVQFAIQQQKQTIEEKQDKEEFLLSVKRSEEQTYESLIAQRQARAQEIRTALFALRDSAAIPFGEALTHANKASQATGVRPAFLLAIIQQESELGENVGTCNRPGDFQTWKDIMPGPNDNSWRDDQTTFKQLMDELGRSPEGMPLSCPWGNGWGGAMGPAQFIPTTWNQYKNRISEALGIGFPDPWNPEHAFTASALYLSDLGANIGGYTAERRAALQYYAGSNWNKPQNSFYGDQVMAKASNIQTTMIDPLQEAN